MRSTRKIKLSIFRTDFADYSYLVSFTSRRSSAYTRHTSMKVY